MIKGNYDALRHFAGRLAWTSQVFLWKNIKMQNNNNNSRTCLRAAHRYMLRRKKES